MIASEVLVHRAASLQSIWNSIQTLSAFFESAFFEHPCMNAERRGAIKTVLNVSNSPGASIMTMGGAKKSRTVLRGQMSSSGATYYTRVLVDINGSSSHFIFR